MAVYVGLCSSVNLTAHTLREATRLDPTYRDRPAKKVLNGSAFSAASCNEALRYLGPNS
jgi:hypothetical protein